MLSTTPLKGSGGRRRPPEPEFCDPVQGCRGSPGADGLSALDWIASLTEDRRTVEEAWLPKLTAEQFRVLRMKGTEEIHSGEYNERFDEGTYACRGCGAALYDSCHKFRTGHGWPAFSDNLPGALARHGSKKVEITCAGCGGHVGHVFKSSRYPAPHHERHCVNSICLHFQGEVD